MHNLGRVATRAQTSHDDIKANDKARQRLPLLMRHKLKPLARVRLAAFRCLDCRHDSVIDLGTGLGWDLDDSDYGDKGSCW